MRPAITAGRRDYPALLGLTLLALSACGTPVVDADAARGDATDSTVATDTRSNSDTSVAIDAVDAVAHPMDVGTESGGPLPDVESDAGGDASGDAGRLVDSCPGGATTYYFSSTDGDDSRRSPDWRVRRRGSHSAETSGKAVR